MYEGIIHLTRSVELRDPTWNYFVLGVAFVVEGVSWLIALRELFKRKDADVGFWQGFRPVKAPLFSLCSAKIPPRWQA